MPYRYRAPFALLLACATPAVAQDGITPASVRAHERFLTSEPLRGRGSATADEAVAAAYVAAQFEAAGLVPVPGMAGYIQSAPVIRRRAAGPVVFTANGRTIAGAAIASFGGGTVTGPLAILRDAGSPIAKGAALLFTGPESERRNASAAARKAGAAMLIFPADKPAGGSPPNLPAYLADSPPAKRVATVFVPAAAAATLRPGAIMSLTLPVAEDRTATTNSIGYLPGTDPTAKLLLVTAHLDHLGIENGVIRQGANDNASGTVAVIELARELARGRRMKRGILFVAYGGEEIGLLGSRWFGAHPPVPLDRIAANIEFEMIGAQDPKLPKGALMMTGIDRSDLGRLLTKHGAKVAADPYPDQHFFERSDNYSLAVKGIVAHTLSGWATVPTYHTADDTFANIDLGFMTAAIRSLVAPLRSLANSRTEPRWTATGRPSE